MTIKANGSGQTKALIAADQTIDQYAYVTVGGLAMTTKERLARILAALVTLRPEAAPPATGHTISDHDARLLATTVRAHVELVDTLHGTLGTTGLDADVRDRLERLLLALDA